MHQKLISKINSLSGFLGVNVIFTLEHHMVTVFSDLQISYI